jgi:hypothetical protein
MRTNTDLYSGAMFLLILSAVFLFAGWLHLQPKFRPSLWPGSRMLNPASTTTWLVCLGSAPWLGPVTWFTSPSPKLAVSMWVGITSCPPRLTRLGSCLSLPGNWGVYAENPDTADHVFGTAQGAGTAILTFLGGFHPQTESLWLTDIAHHHLAIAVIFIIAGHMYRTNFGIGHSIKEILACPQSSQGPPLVAWVKVTRVCTTPTTIPCTSSWVGPGLFGGGDLAGGAAHVLAASLCLHRQGLHHPSGALYPPPVHCWVLDGGGLCPRGDLPDSGL